MPTREERLIEDVKRGGSEAKRLLYDTYAGALYSVAMRYVGRRDVAEDMVHDSFIKVFRSFEGFSYRGEGSLKAWMVRITINTSLEWLRAQKRMGEIADLEGVEAEEEPTISEVEQIPQEILMRLIGELPDGYRTIFNLFCVEGYSHREIAKELGIKEKSSSSQLLRAKRLLASKIKAIL
ncbi:MAG: sigma-70 family RNA polymerase sigma factor [Rikenellaceae bacterium]